ncbi:MAG TPA: DUF664 domain-containing protein [Acidimicrobiia bacterium]|jgi:hypothetical protein
MSERDLLTGFLDWLRAVVERKVADLSLENATRIMTPSGLSPLGIVKHLGDVERRWFAFGSRAKTLRSFGRTTTLTPTFASSRTTPSRQ